MTPVRRSLRRHLSPLGADTASMLDLPPVRMGLLDQAQPGDDRAHLRSPPSPSPLYYGNQRWRDDEQQLHAHGASLVAVMTELAEYDAVHGRPARRSSRSWRAWAPIRRWRTCAVLGGQRGVLAERRFLPSLARTAAARARP